MSHEQAEKNLTTRAIYLHNKILSKLLSFLSLTSNIYFESFF